MKKFEMLWELPKCDRDRVRKCCRKNGTSELTWYSFGTNVQFVKIIIYVKHNKTSYACISQYSDVQTDTAQDTGKNCVCENIYSYPTSSNETDLCVQTATSVDCVNDWDVQGTENCSRPQDCELQSPVRKLRKTQLKENMALAISTFQSLTLQAESLSWSPMGFTNCLWRSPYQQVCIPNTKFTTKILF